MMMTMKSYNSDSQKIISKIRYHEFETLSGSTKSLSILIGAYIDNNNRWQEPRCFLPPILKRKMLFHCNFSRICLAIDDGINDIDSSVPSRYVNILAVTFYLP